jgi:hypothetical protein
MQTKANLVFRQNLPADQADELVMNQIVADPQYISANGIDTGSTNSRPPQRRRWIGSMPATRCPAKPAGCVTAVRPTTTSANPGRSIRLRRRRTTDRGESPSLDRHQ